ncbi:MAG TPA: hypothetical protein VKF82_00835 [Candidatus Eremiobacteraceae bacterium]|nr:hypothetical protein [Candidatus Eremiobacteraceae bacterium]
MFYVELLRVRNGLIVAVAGLIALVLVGWIGFAAACPECRRLNAADPATVLAVIGYSAAILAAIFGSVFGASLSIENDGHLPLTWTKPISRGAQAIGILTIDITAALAVFVLSCAAGWLFVSLVGERPLPVHASFDTVALLKLARFAAFPVAMFGLTQALTAGIKGSWQGAVTGPLWPVCQGLFAIGLLPLTPPLHKLWQIVNIPNPIAYFPFWEFDEHIFHVYPFGYGVAIDALALAAIAFVGVTIATLRWRRLEA